MRVEPRVLFVALAIALPCLYASGASAEEGQPATGMPQPKRPWGPEQATGAPDTPQAGDLPTAWASLRPNAGLEWLMLGYPQAVEIAEIRIRETWNPGAVTKVVALVENGREQVLWEGQDPTDVAPADFVVKPKVRVASHHIKIYLQTAGRKPGWAEIDAVELIGADGSRQWASTASASSTFAERPNPGGQQFTDYSGNVGQRIYRGGAPAPVVQTTYREEGPAPYEGLVGRWAKVYLEGGQTLEGVFRGSDAQFVVLQQRQGNKTILVNKNRVLYVEIPN